VVFLDAIVVKVRDNHVVQNKPAYLAVGIDADGEKHVLGIWVAKTAPESAAAGEGAGFWRAVMADLRNRGVRDILIACKLPEFPDIEDPLETVLAEAEKFARLAADRAADRVTLAGQLGRQPAGGLGRPSAAATSDPPLLRLDQGQQRRAQPGIQRGRPPASPPGLRARLSGSSPDSSSPAPRATVASRTPAVRPTARIPPCPSARASAPISSRRCRSSRCGKIAWNFAASITRVSSMRPYGPWAWRWAADLPRAVGWRAVVAAPWTPDPSVTDAGGRVRPAVWLTVARPVPALAAGTVS
jgi:hypothetical protein